MNPTCLHPAVKLGLLRPGRTSRLLLLAPLLAFGTSAHLAATPPQQVVPRYTLTNPGSTFINPLLNGEGPQLNIQGAIIGIIQPPGGSGANFLKCMFLSGEKALQILGGQDRGPKLGSGGCFSG